MTHMINLILIGISIVWLWFGVRINYLRHGEIFENIHVSPKLKRDVEDILSNRMIERRAKIIGTLVLLIIEVIAYIYNDQSLVIVYVLSVGWLLFYLINLEVSTIYKIIDKKGKFCDENSQ